MFTHPEEQELGYTLHTKKKGSSLKKNKINAIEQILSGITAACAGEHSHTQVFYLFFYDRQ